MFGLLDTLDLLYSVITLPTATMASLAEFYITTLWSYQPEVIKQVINDLTDMGFVSSLNSGLVGKQL